MNCARLENYASYSGDPYRRFGTSYRSHLQGKAEPHFNLILTTVILYISTFFYSLLSMYYERCTVRDIARNKAMRSLSVVSQFIFI